MIDETVSWEFLLPIRAQPKQRPRLGRHGVYTPTKTAKFEGVVRMLVASKWKRPALIGAVKVELVCVFKKAKSNKRDFMTQRPDLDNLIKACADALNGLIYEDDCQIVGASIQKIFGDRDEIRIKVTRLE